MQNLPNAAIFAFHPTSAALGEKWLMELPRQQVQFFSLARRLLNFGSCQLQLVGIACFSAQLSVATP